MSNPKGGTGKLPPVSGDTPQTAVLLVQFEALEHDETIRSELKKKGFVITTQALVYLSPQDARDFVFDVSNPSSSIYAKPAVGENLDTVSAEASHEKMASSRSPRYTAEDNTNDMVAGLAQGPVLVLALEKVNAIAELVELVGPATSDLRISEPRCLRARYGVDAKRFGVYCTLHESTASHELAFLLAHTHTSPVVGRHRDEHTVKTLKSAVVQLTQLVEFLFPVHVLHPNSTGRLYVFGLYGPLDSQARLLSGEKGLHVVTDRELDSMSNRIEREDILAVYEMCSLSQEEEEEVLRTVDGVLKTFPRHSRRDVEALFSKLPRAPDGTVSFHEIQAAIIKERCRRVLCMKERVHPALAPPIKNKFRASMVRVMKTKQEIAPVSMFLKDIGFTGAENATLVSRLLSNHAYEICQLDDCNSPELTQNVRLLRDRVQFTQDPRVPWSSNTTNRTTGL